MSNKINPLARIVIQTEDIMFFRKWYWTLSALIVISMVGFLLLRPNTPPEPVKTYKVVTSVPGSNSIKANIEETDITTSHSHDHSHDTVSHSHTAEPFTRDDTYNWQIATLLKRSKGTIKTHLRNARLQLRELLTPYLKNQHIPWLT